MTGEPAGRDEAPGGDAAGDGAAAVTVEPPVVRSAIEAAVEDVGRVWPLYADVAANPLSGFEHRNFHDAVRHARTLFGGRGYPTPEQFRRALAAGRIDRELLETRCARHGYEGTAEELLAAMAEPESGGCRDAGSAEATATETLDRLLSKWLAAFLDEGEATWPMPDREDGFYAAWRRLAPHDGTIPDAGALGELPETPMEALAAVLSGHDERRWEAIARHHLAALPGWTGFVRRRTTAPFDPWQLAHPISLEGYLAVRLVLADHLGVPVDPGPEPDVDREAVTLPELFLRAWEESYRRSLFDDLRERLPAIESGAAGGAAGGCREEHADGEGTDRPDAQLVFCIDTRSEVLRRHLERAGDYETYGYAGFFGIPMEYERYGAEATTKSCPAVVDPEHRVVDRPKPRERETAALHDTIADLRHAAHDLKTSLKNDVAAAFGFVEGAGGLFGIALAARTLLPHRLGRNLSGGPSPDEFCAPTVGREGAGGAAAGPGTDGTAGDGDGAGGAGAGDGELPLGMTLEQRTTYAANAFERMGVDPFSRLVVFAGHGSRTVNNPFESSLDCGACAGSPGGPNARALARICNERAVRERLAERGIEIPSDTVFVAAEHNTTTDEVTVFADDDEVPGTHRHTLGALRRDLERARERAAAERVADLAPGEDAVDAGEAAVREAERRAADWAETRPETGLSGNAAFVVGPRELTAALDLEGRAFLHAYDPSSDPTGEALEAILAGPLVVGHMINAQYYFSTVDSAVYGSGSKVTQNPVGGFGVYQGNGGDLLTGLPRQSVRADDGRLHHQPLRLTAVLCAPVERVRAALQSTPSVRRLADNGWLSLAVADPTTGRLVRYRGDLTFGTGDPVERAGATPPSRPAATDGAGD